MKPRLSKSKISFCLCFAFLLLSASSAGYAQDSETAKFPVRPITFIVPLPPGSPVTAACRLISNGAEKYLGQPITIVNKPGGSLTVGLATVAAGKPDGYTIGYAGHSAVFVAPFIQKLPYHPLKDLKPLMQFGGVNFGVIVKADSPFKSFQDLVAFASQNPKKLTYGTAGAQSMQYIIMEQIAKKEKVEITHMPFNGTSEVEIALLGGQVLVGVGDFNYSLVEAGRTRPVALLKDERSAEYPKTPILKDLGYNIPCPMTLNVFTANGVPDAIAKKLEEAYTQALKEPAFMKGMKEDLHLPVGYRNHKDLADYTNRNYEVYGKFLKEMGLAK